MMSLIAISCTALCTSSTLAGEHSKSFRPPAVPLVAHDPYFSIWSPADRLTDADTVHWTAKPHSLRSLLRVDGKPYRLMGTQPADVAPMQQTGLTVTPTRTIYNFTCPEIRVKLSFMSPALPEDLDVLSRPLTYLTWDVQSADGKKHAVEIYFDASSNLAVNTPDQTVAWSKENIPGLVASSVGTDRQPVLSARGDDRRIDWGYLYSAAPTGTGVEASISAGAAARSRFVAEGRVATTDDSRMPRPVSDEEAVLATSFAFSVARSGHQSRYLMLAYDDLYSINYFGQKLRPYWRRNGTDAQGLLSSAASSYAALRKKCESFDEKVTADLHKTGGEKYALMCALLYRQCLAGNKLAADSAGMPMLFPKENTSNGCIGTIDVIYPMSPMFLLLSPGLARAMLAPVLSYASSPRWKFAFSPHDLGVYPKAIGQAYGGGELTEHDQMPVEESGDMIIMIAALSRVEGDCDFAERYWQTISKWAEYLRQHGMDPANQLCTDDFAGAFAHNVNLSAKAIIALGAYGWMCEQTGRQTEAREYQELARQYAAEWVKTADDGDHTRLAFDRPGTWSQKYNLVWDRILGLDLFPAKIARDEVAYYKKMANAYGAPLDSRHQFAKLDWAIWAATLSEDRAGFESLIDPVYRFLNDVAQRNPAADLYSTHKAEEIIMHARPVVGGAFIAVLKDTGLWRRWASRGERIKGEWAPIPAPRQSTAVVPTAEKEPIAWHYTFEQPSAGWFGTDFDDSAWSEGQAGFGVEGTPGAVVRTNWNTADIWMRRTFELSDSKLRDPKLRVHHDEDAEVYINGVLAAQTTGYLQSYEDIDITEQGCKALKSGINTIAVHCHQTLGGQYIDVGITEAK